MYRNKQLIFQALIGFIPILFYIIVVGDLPNQIPLHYNLALEPDKFGSKYLLLLVLFVVYILNLFLSFILLNLGIADPKTDYKSIETISKKISWILNLLLLFLSSFIVYQTICYSNGISSLLNLKIILIGSTILLIFLGIQMNSIGQNSYIGYRTPWNLNNEINWVKTHKFGSKLWVYLGPLIIGLIVVLPQSFSFGVFLSGLVIICFSPLIYSYWLFRKGS